MVSTTYIHQRLSYYFSSSQIIDLQVGDGLAIPMPVCLDILERTSASYPGKQGSSMLEASLSLLAHILKPAPGQQSQDPVLLIDRQQFTRLYDSDGLRCCVFALRACVDALAHQPAKANIGDEMIVKTLMNLVYTIIFGYGFVRKSEGHSALRDLLEELDLDGLLINMVSITLEAYYLPIKKLVMLYARVLTILFSAGQNSANTSPHNLYDDSQMLWLSSNNLLTDNFLQTLKDKNKAEQATGKKKIRSNPIQDFYTRHNVGDCPLAQSIVVGLLRSLLTICNSQGHKKFQTNLPKGSGADSYREWQISYQFFQYSTPTDKDSTDYKQFLSATSMRMMKDYYQYNEAAGQGSSAEKQAAMSTLPTHFQFYRHKIYTTLAISTFFSLLLVSLRKNTPIQFTYLYQLISDANGVLVFLKFLTDKFESLDPESSIAGEATNCNIAGNLVDCSSLQFCLKFKDEVMLTVYSVLLVLFGACNNYTQKTRSYLFEYNSYLIIKKIPHIFMQVHKNDDQLPSEEEIEAEFGSKSATCKSSNRQSAYQCAIKSKVKQLTELCYSLLKIQIPFFSKKMKENSNNMKMIVEIYCQMPKKTEAIDRSELDKLLLKNQMRKIQQEKYVVSVEELKAIHNEYNNLYYWSNQQLRSHEEQEKAKSEPTGPFPKREEIQKWLEEEVWKFYD